RYVKEEEYNRIASAVSSLMGEADTFEESFDQLLHGPGEPAAGSVSEYLADMYQEIRDCLLQYQTGTEEVMNDAIWECSMTFETLWGRKLLSVLRAIHPILYSGTGAASLDENSGTARQKGHGDE
ncbi:MAG: DUF5063 domain-containing protein, partial [Bacteroidetes bacterium]|nr:DUF5063 domain-containing protein [Bacteroidota bacterium]